MIWDDGGPLTGLVNSAAGNFIARTEDVLVNGFHALTDNKFHRLFYDTTPRSLSWFIKGIKAIVVSVDHVGIRGSDKFGVLAKIDKAGRRNVRKQLSNART